MQPHLPSFFSEALEASGADGDICVRRHRQRPLSAVSWKSFCRECSVWLDFLNHLVQARNELFFSLVFCNIRKARRRAQMKTAEKMSEALVQLRDVAYYPYCRDVEFSRRVTKRIKPPPCHALYVVSGSAAQLAARRAAVDQFVACGGFCGLR